tara:strand:+ start:71 stop:226 length:156 start_codon:yes stop_codon:yes gene_type:complete
MISHEELCAERYSNICDRLERGKERMSRIEVLIWTVYPWTVALIVAADYVR